MFHSKSFPLINLFLSSLFSVPISYFSMETNDSKSTLFVIYLFVQTNMKMIKYYLFYIVVGTKT